MEDLVRVHRSSYADREKGGQGWFRPGVRMRSGLLKGFRHLLGHRLLDLGRDVLGDPGPVHHEFVDEHREDDQTDDRDDDPD
jgi:hypothetical protein